MDPSAETVLNWRGAASTRARLTFRSAELDRGALDACLRRLAYRTGRARELRNGKARASRTSAEFDLSGLLRASPALSRDSLLDGRSSFECSIDVLVSRIRRKIAQSGRSHHHQDGAFRRLFVYAQNGSRLRRPATGVEAMRPFGFFHLKGIGGQIAALAPALHSRAASRRHHRHQPARPSGPAAPLIAGFRAAAWAKPRDIARAFPKPTSRYGRGGHRRSRTARVSTSTGSVRPRLQGGAARARAPTASAWNCHGAMIGATVRAPGSGAWRVTLMTAFISISVSACGRRALATPLSSFAKAAREEFQPRRHRLIDPPRALTPAMGRLMSDRTRMLAAISH